MNKHIFLASCALVALSVTATAADLPRRTNAAAPSPALVGNWSGFYVGVSSGASLASNQLTTSSVYAAGGWFAQSSVDKLNSIGKVDVSSAHPLVSLSIGHNTQFNNTVVGVELDATMMRLRKNTSITDDFPPAFSPNKMTVNQKASSDWLVTLRPRVGMLISNYLVYGTAGVALAQEKGEFSFSSTYNNSESGSFNRTKFGWVAGAGLERKFSQNLSLKAEYLFVNINEAKTTSSNFTGSALNVFTHKLDINQNLIRVGVNYKFGG